MSGLQSSTELYFPKLDVFFVIFRIFDIYPLCATWIRHENEKNDVFQTFHDISQLFSFSPKKFEEGLLY